MAVYERTYHTYSGPVTPEKSRFLVLPRYAYREVFQSRFFVAFFVACFVWPLVLAVMIYLPHNVSFLKAIQTEASSITSLFKYDATFFFKFFMWWHGLLAFVMAFVVGPALISADLRNNGLPLYLSRPFSRAEYILGKSTVMILLLSSITWIPGLLLFGLQCYLGGWSWFREHGMIGISILLSFAIWILILCLICLSLSAYVKWKPVARAALFGVFFVLSALGGLVNLLLDTSWGSLIDIFGMVMVVWSGLFGIPGPVDVPVWAAWGSLIAFCAICLLLLSRKVRAYEIVRS